jgi:hypothetical protein
MEVRRFNCRVGDVRAAEAAFLYMSLKNPMVRSFQGRRNGAT